MTEYVDIPHDRNGDWTSVKSAEITTASLAIDGVQYPIYGVGDRNDRENHQYSGQLNRKIGSLHYPNASNTGPFMPETELAFFMYGINNQYLTFEQAVQKINDFVRDRMPTMRDRISRINLS